MTTTMNAPVMPPEIAVEFNKLNEEREGLVEEAADLRGELMTVRRRIEEIDFEMVTLVAKVVPSTGDAK